MFGLIAIITNVQLNFSFETDVTVSLGDWFTLLGVITAAVAIIYGYKAHARQVRPYLNFLQRFDLETGTVTFYIENVGGGYAKINSAFFKFKSGFDTGYVGEYPWLELRGELYNVPNLIREQLAHDKLVDDLFNKANQTFREYKVTTAKEICAQYAKYNFTLDNAIGKDEKSELLVISHDYLKSDTEHKYWREAFFAHCRMLELFVEYESVAKQKLYLPSKNLFISAKSTDKFNETSPLFPKQPKCYKETSEYSISHINVTTSKPNSDE